RHLLPDGLVPSQRRPHAPSVCRQEPFALRAGSEELCPNPVTYSQMPCFHPPSISFSVDVRQLRAGTVPRIACSSAGHRGFRGPRVPLIPLRSANKLARLRRDLQWQSVRFWIKFVARTGSLTLSFR